MLDRLLAIAAGGGSLVLGLVDDDGAPIVGRGWALVAEDADSLTVLTHLDDDLRRGAVAGRNVAVTTAHVLTYEAIQAKGLILDVSEPSAHVLASVTERTGRFISAVAQAHRDDESAITAMVPPDVLAIRFSPDAMTDQTPGGRAKGGTQRE